nr:hypothetical protein [Rhizobium sp. L58/93]
MNSRPAYELVTIAHGGNTVSLRPSLRAAATLEARFGFPAIFRALDEGSLTVISEIILAASFSRQDAATFLGGNSGRPLSSFLDAVCQPLAELVLMFMPAPDPKEERVEGGGKLVAWADFYADLYQMATGWLGWTPETTWNATPTEISRAFIGHIAMLKTIHGSGDDKEDHQPEPDQAARNIAAGLDPEFDRNALRALKSKIAGGA